MLSTIVALDKEKQMQMDYWYWLISAMLKERIFSMTRDRAGAPC